MADILRLNNISKTYPSGERTERRITVLKNASLTLKSGEMVGLVAPSGAGKTTLLHIAGLLENAEQGEITINDYEIKNTNDQILSQLRLKTIGFVYQFHHLLAEFSALENIILPQLVAGRSHHSATKHAEALLKSVGLSARAQHRPAGLSGGEKQRVAFCRALANQPTLLIADEPTGNLDPASAERVFSVMIELARNQGLSALIATHNLALAEKKLDRILTLEDGGIKEYESPIKRGRA